MQPPDEGSLRTLGRALRVARTVRSIKRRDIAQRTGLSYAYLSQIERGVRTPSSRALQAIADALDMTPSELLAMADSVAEATPHETLLAASFPPAAPPEEQRSRWFSPAAEAPPMAAMSAAPSAPQPSQSDERPSDQDLADLVAVARDLARSDLRLLTELARRLRG